MELLDGAVSIIPFPSLYETINTRFSKRKDDFSAFKNHILSERCTFIHDDAYKRMALENTFDSALLHNRPISFVDMIIRMMIEDVNIMVHGLLTFNPGDFCDACAERRIEMLP